MFEYLAEKDAFEESEAVDFMTQFLSGVSHLHARNVVHLDLKVARPPALVPTAWVHCHIDSHCFFCAAGEYPIDSEVVDILHQVD